MPLTDLISALELTDHAVRTSQPFKGPVPWQSRRYSQGNTETLLCSALVYRGAAIKIEGDPFCASYEERRAYTEEAMDS